MEDCLIYMCLLQASDEGVTGPRQSYRFAGAADTTAKCSGLDKQCNFVGSMAVSHPWEIKAKGWTFVPAFRDTHLFMMSAGH